MQDAAPLLLVEDLGVSITGPSGAFPVLDRVSFAVGRGEVTALVGESGSGKTLSALSVMGLLPGAAQVTSGRVAFDGEVFDPTQPRALRPLRGDRIAMIFQEPATSLNPVLTVGEQIAEVLVRHRGLSWADAGREAVRLLDRVGIPDAARRATQYIHQMSGGMRQRVMIASAIACRPSLLVADEPTTALDVTIQAQILDLIRDLQAEMGMGVLLITHDLGVVAEVADRASVMYAGRIVEQGPAAGILKRPLMPYTRGLLRSLPRPDAASRLVAIPGMVPDLRSVPSGCAFRTRCPHAVEACAAGVPALEAASPGHAVRCIRWRELPPEADIPVSASSVRQQDRPILKVRGLRKHFPARGGLFAGRGVVHAVEDVDFEVRRGEIVGLVGESGSGKTTIGRTILRLIEPTAGAIEFDGVDVAHASAATLKALRRRMQIVFQDPFASLNPTQTVGALIGEPLLVHGLARGAALDRRVAELLELVGLRPEHAARRPHAFSGGQRQRIAIARALALEPELLVADEAVSALDVSIRAQIVNLLAELRDRLGLAILFIGHDLGLVRHLCDRVVVLYLGRVMEEGPAGDVFGAPHHPYTSALLSAAPTPDPDAARDRIILRGDVPSPTAPPSGCVFRTRCPKADAACAERVPPLLLRGEGRVACIRPG